MTAIFQKWWRTLPPRVEGQDAFCADAADKHHMTLQNQWFLITQNKLVSRPELISISTNHFGPRAPSHLYGSL